MTQASSLLRVYDAAVDMTERMLTAARSQDWQSLFLLREQYEMLVAEIRSFDPHLALSNDELEARTNYLQRLVDNSSEVMELASTRMTLLKTILGSSASATPPVYPH